MSNQVIALIAILVGADLIVTALLLRHLRRKKRREERPGSEGW